MSWRPRLQDGILSRTRLSAESQASASPRSPMSPRSPKPEVSSPGAPAGERPAGDIADMVAERLQAKFQGLQTTVDAHLQKLGAVEALLESLATQMNQQQQRWQEVLVRPTDTVGIRPIGSPRPSWVGHLFYGHSGSYDWQRPSITSLFGRESDSRNLVSHDYELVGHKPEEEEEEEGGEDWDPHRGCCDEDHESTGCLASLVNSTFFNRFAFLVILLNTAFLWGVTDYIASSREPEKPWMEVVEMFFLAYYTLEVLLKLIVKRRNFFYNKEEWRWNAFDLVVVIAGLVQVTLELFKDSHNFGSAFIRLCRILRVFKILRIIRAAEYLPDLKTMAAAVTGSMDSLFWASLFLLIILMMAALVFVQGMSSYQAEHADCDEYDFRCQQIPVMFGTISLAMVVLLQSTTGGISWGDVYDVIKLSGLFNSLLYLSYVVFFTFAFFNIIVGMFVEKAMKLSTPAETQRIQEIKKTQEKYCEDLRILMHQLDTNNSGTICEGELQAVFENKKHHMKLKMDMLGISARQAKLFLKSLKAEEEKKDIEIDEFVKACMDFHGPATGIDLHALTARLHELELKVDANAKQGPQRSSMQRPLRTSDTGNNTFSVASSDRQWRSSSIDHQRP